MKITKYNASELSRLIEKRFGREFNVPYEIMQEQRKITVEVEAEATEEQKEFILQWLAGASPNEDIFQAILNVLGSEKKLKPGDYMLCFDD